MLLITAMGTIAGVAFLAAVCFTPPEVVIEADTYIKHNVRKYKNKMTNICKGMRQAIYVGSKLCYLKVRDRIRHYFTYNSALYPSSTQTRGNDAGEASQKGHRSSKETTPEQPQPSKPLKKMKRRGVPSAKTLPPNKNTRAVFDADAHF